MTAQRPDAVFLAAAVCGILANDRRPAEFLFDNLAIQSAVIESARLAGVAKLVFLGSSCIYPGPAAADARGGSAHRSLEPTNEWYAVAKIAGIKLCQAYRRQHGCNFISLMPANLYGPGDNFDLDSAHVVPALMRRMHEARVAGEGRPRCGARARPAASSCMWTIWAAAALFLMERYAGERPLHVGTGRDLTIGALAEAIRGIVGFEGRLVHDRSKPDGAPRRLLDITRMNRLGWRAKVELRPGLARTYRWFLDAGPASMAQVLKRNMASGQPFRSWTARRFRAPIRVLYRRSGQRPSARLPRGRHPSSFAGSRPSRSARCGLGNGAAEDGSPARRTGPRRYRPAGRTGWALCAMGHDRVFFRLYSRDFT